MLLRFGIGNYLSISDYQEISCAASVGLKDDVSHLMEYISPRGAKRYFVPVVALYGANAAGKSNMIAGLAFIFNSVKKSYSQKENNFNTRNLYCSADVENINKPSHFDCDVVIEGIRYTYGFSLSNDNVSEEWLYSYEKGQRKVVFDRSFLKGVELSGGIEKQLDSSLKKRFSDKSSLFLSVAGTLQFEPLIRIYQFFIDEFNHISANNIPRDAVIAKDLADKKTKTVIEEFLKKADPGLINIKIVNKKIQPEQKIFQHKIGQMLKEITGEDISFPNSDTEAVIKFVHQRPDGTTYEINKNFESSGTRQLLSLLAPLISALRSGGIVVLDEITTALHTHLSKELIKLFSDKESNPNGAQLIFTTHDTNLLSCGELRRDQIWFAEKDPAGRTCIYPLTDFKVRKSENIEKGYLQGRFGAVPFFGGVASILAR